MWTKRSIDSQTSNPIAKMKRIEQYSKMMTRQIQRVVYEDTARRITMPETVRMVQANQQVARASDWVSLLRGTEAGVYLLYGHLGCDWRFTHA
eukprot:12931763-Prorocentrum_lima.AAC.1